MSPLVTNRVEPMIYRWTRLVNTIAILNRRRAAQSYDGFLTQTRISEKRFVIEKIESWFIRAKYYYRKR